MNKLVLWKYHRRLSTVLCRAPTVEQQFLQKRIQAAYSQYLKQ